MLDAVAVVFAKYHRPGAVKTRLIPAIGARAAARVQALMTAATLQRARSWGRAGLVLAADPQPQAFDISGVDGALPQGGGDLGERISRVHQTVFARFGRPILTLGTDAPDLPDALVAEVLAAISAGAVGMCPSSDGGYCAIGVPRPLPELFRGIAWGGEQVADQTRAAARRCGVRLIETTAWRDVDTLDDLAALIERTGHTADPSLRRLHAGLVSEKLDW